MLVRQVGLSMLAHNVRCVHHRGEQGQGGRPSGSRPQTHARQGGVGSLRDLAHAIVELLASLVQIRDQIDLLV